MLDTEQSIKNKLTENKIQSAIQSYSPYLELDIHYYKQLNGISRLEQDAIRNEKTLTEEERQLAVFDRDRWEGLYDLGISDDDAEKVALSFYGDDYCELIEKNINLKVTELDDLTLCSIIRNDFKKTEVYLQRQVAKKWYNSSTKADEAYPLKPLLILQHEEAESNCSINKASRIDFIGHVHHFDFFAELLCNNYWQSYFKMELCQGKFLLHFRATRKDSSSDLQGKSFDQFINEILSVVLVSGRPLRHYNATFYLPLNLEKIKEFPKLDIEKSLPSAELTETLKIALDKKEELENYKNYNDNEIKAQTQRYYSPLLQAQLFDSKSEEQNTESSDEIKPIKEYQLNTGMFKTVELVGTEEPKLEIKRLSIFKHGMDQGLLAIQLQMPEKNRSKYWDKCEKADKPDWWHDLFKEPGQAKTCQIENYLRFTHAFRTLYPSFLEQKTEDKLKEFQFDNKDSNLAIGFNNFVIEVLEEAGIISNKNLKIKDIKENLRDDRMFVNVAYALAGSSPNNSYAKAENHRLFHLALNVDRQQDASANGYVYDSEYVHQEQDKNLYKRWKNYGSYCGFTDHSHVYMGYRRFMRETFVPVHAPYLYARMTILNLLYREQLRHFEHQLCSCAEHNQGSISSLYEKLATFTNQYWFREVTEQQQGKEIYRMQADSLGLDSIYETINKEIKATRQHQAQKEKYKKEEQQRFFSSIALLLTLIGVVFALLPVKELMENMLKPIIELIPDKTLHTHFYLVLVQIIVVIFSTLIVYSIRKGMPNNKEKQKKCYWQFLGNYLVLQILFIIFFYGLSRLVQLSFLLTGISGSPVLNWIVLIVTVISVFCIYSFRSCFWFSPQENSQSKKDVPK